MPESARVLELLARRPACPQAPPVGARFSTGEDAALLSGPSSAPPGAITCTAGTHDIAALTNSNAAGSTFWLSPGVHKILNVDNPTDEASAIYAQIKCKTGNTYIGAPGAILDGQNPSFPTKYARIHFTGANGATNSGVTIKTLEIRNFKPDMEQYSGNVDNAPNWLWEGVNLHDCNNGINIGTGTSGGTPAKLLNCWLHDNGQYGCATYGKPVNDGLSPGLVNVEVAYCEINANGTWQDEFATNGTGPLGSGAPSGNGRNGAMKFWDTSGMNVHHNWIHHNEYTAIWADTNNVNLTVADNYVNDNFGVAVFYEISYNFGIQRNTFLRNAIFSALNFASRGDNFPFPAVYISESGGDSTVHTNWATSYVGGETVGNGNVFVDNANEIALWENPNRFCNSRNNTSHKIWKPLQTVSGVIASLAQCNIPTEKTLTVTLTAGSPNFTVTSGSLAAVELTNGSPDEGRPVSGTGIPTGAKIWEPTSAETLDQRGIYSTTTGRLNVNATITGSTTMTVAAGSITTEPYYTACRWPTKNVKVKNNLHAIDPDVVKAVYPTVTIPAGVNLGKVALFSQPGTDPSWSPYTATGPFGAGEIQDRVTFENGNEWANNTYVGPHYFMPYETSIKTYEQWRAAPYNQDAGSSTESGSSGGGTVPAVWSKVNGTTAKASGFWSKVNGTVSAVVSRR